MSLILPLPVPFCERFKKKGGEEGEGGRGTTKNTRSSRTITSCIPPKKSKFLLTFYSLCETQLGICVRQTLLRETGIIGSSDNPTRSSLSKLVQYANICNGVTRARHLEAPFSFRFHVSHFDRYIIQVRL